MFLATAAVPFGNSKSEIGSEDAAKENSGHRKTVGELDSRLNAEG